MFRSLLPNVWDFRLCDWSSSISGNIHVSPALTFERTHWMKPRSRRSWGIGSIRRDCSTFSASSIEIAKTWFLMMTLARGS